MGHPGKLLSSQVVAIQWYLLQGHMLVFVKRYKQLYLPWNSEHVCAAKLVNFKFKSMCLRGKEISFVRCQLSVGCVAQPRPVAVETCSKLSLR